MNSKEEILRILSEEINKRRLSKKEVADIIGIKGSDQNKIQKINRFFDLDNSKIHWGITQKMIEAFKLSPEEVFLFHGKGKKRIQSLEQFFVQEKHLVPLIKKTSTPAAQLERSDIAEWISMPLASSPKQHFAIPVQRDVAGFKDEEIIFVSTDTHRYNLDESKVVAKVADCWDIFDFKRTKKHIVLSNEHRHFELDPQEEFELVGVVTHVLSELH